MEIIHLVLGKANPLRMNGVNKVVHELAEQQCASGLKASVWGITAQPVHDYPAAWLCHIPVSERATSV